MVVKEVSLKLYKIKIPSLANLLGPLHYLLILFWKYRGNGYRLLPLKLNIILINTSLINCKHWWNRNLICKLRKWNLKNLVNTILISYYLSQISIRCVLTVARLYCVPCNEIFFKVLIYQQRHYCCWHDWKFPLTLDNVMYFRNI